MQTNINQFYIGQEIRMTYPNGLSTQGKIVEITSDRVRAVPFGQTDDGIGFGFMFRAIGRVISVEIL